MLEKESIKVLEGEFERAKLHKWHQMVLGQFWLLVTLKLRYPINISINSDTCVKMSFWYMNICHNTCDIY